MLHTAGSPGVSSAGTCDQPWLVAPRSQSHIPGAQFLPRVCKIREFLQPWELQEAVSI